MVLTINEETKDTSHIQKFYANSCVLITGATGFLGQLLLEILLRACPDVKKIFILIREKRDKTSERRVQELLEDALFNNLKKLQPHFAEKLVTLTGDCALPDLGLNQDDKQKIINEVNCIFHCAATVRFDEKLRTAAYINIRATKDLLEIARKATNLRSFVYVSTAFSHCNRNNVNEEFYAAPLLASDLLSLLNLKDEWLDVIAPILRGNWPNTYTFTKAIAEEMVHLRGQKLPIAIVRPAIVTATAWEPLPGWINNYYGLTGVIANSVTGLFRILPCRGSYKADIVPADYVVNCTLAVGWDVGTKSIYSTLNKENSTHISKHKQNSYKTDYHSNTLLLNDQQNVENEEKVQSSSNRICIYNYVASTEDSVTWSESINGLISLFKEIPTTLAIWYPLVVLCSHKRIFNICAFLLHAVPAHCVDFYLMAVGKNPRLVKHYKITKKFLDGIRYFGTSKWQFENQNVKTLWKKLNKADQELFCFDLTKFDWKMYYHNYAKGIRVYVLKDPMDTLPQGRSKSRKLRAAHYTLIILLLLIIFKLHSGIWHIGNFITSYVKNVIY